MRLYKLTTRDGKTRSGCYNECRWGEGVTHRGTGEGPLCGPGWIHAYTSPLLAELLNPIHADIPDPLLWEAEGDIALTDNGLKVGCLSLTTIRTIPLPSVTTEQRVRFAILCAKQVCTDPAWNNWADRWLDGTDRSVEAAVRAVSAAAAEAAEAWAAEAAEAWAARSAAWAAEAAEAWAARSAAWAARSAAAAAAAEAASPVELIMLAQQAYGETL